MKMNLVAEIFSQFLQMEIMEIVRINYIALYL